MSINLTSMKTDTTNILTDWGETVSIVTNAPTYNSAGMQTDVWGSAVSETADIQPVSGNTIMAESGLQHKSTHEIFLKFDTVAIAGKRIRPAGWASGNDEYIINYMKLFEEHAIAFCTLVKGHH